MRGKANVGREEAKTNNKPTNHVQKLLVMYNHGGKGNLVPPQPLLIEKFTEM